MIIEDEKLLEKLLQLQKLEAEIDMVLNKHKKEVKHCCSAYTTNKSLGLELNSPIGKFMALGAYLNQQEK